MEHVMTVIKSLADGNRLRAVAALIDHEELCACQITELLKVSGATVSRHLSILVNAGVLQSRKEGRWVYYRLAKNSDVELLNWVRSRVSDSAQIAADRKSLAAIMRGTPEDLCRKQRGDRCCPTPSEAPGDVT